VTDRGVDIVQPEASAANAGSPDVPSDALTAPESVQEPRPGSALEHLRRKVQKARETRVLDLDVPTLDGAIVVRFRPITATELADIYKRRRNTPLEEQSLMSAADVCAKTCIGIYERSANGELVTDGEYLASEDGRPVTFATLGLASTGRAVDEVRALYTADGDVIGTSNAVVEFSGFAEKITGAIQGE